VAKHNIVTDDSKAVGKLVATTADGPMKSVVTTRWHLIVHKELGDQLYDWVHDPGETNNLLYTPLGQQVARELDSRLEGLLARSEEKLRVPVSISLHDGKFIAHEDPAHESLMQPGADSVQEDYYRLEAKAGSTVEVEVRAQQVSPTLQLDPVISIVDGNGQPYRTCRNPGDDHTRAPGIADPTPDAFDDICVNDDVDPGVTSAARLEILVPEGSKPRVELNIRVSDWNGQTGVQLPYEMQVREAGPSSEAAKAGGQ